MKAYLDVIKFALSKGHTISVFDGEEWYLKMSTSYNAIKKEVEGVETAILRVRHHSELDQRGERKVIGDFYVMPYETPDESVYDHTANDYCDQWFEQFENKLN